MAHKRGEGYKLPTTFTFYAEFPTYFMALISLFMAPSMKLIVVVVVFVVVVVSCKLLLLVAAINASNSFSFGCLNECLSFSFSFPVPASLSHLTSFTRTLRKIMFNFNAISIQC